MLHKNMLSSKRLDSCTMAVAVDISPSESDRICYNFKISSLFGCIIKECPSTQSPILSHHKFLMGSLDDSCQSNICSAFPLSRGAPVDLYLTSTGKQCDGREGVWFPVSCRREEKKTGRGTFMTTVYLGGGQPLFPFFP